MNPADLKIEPVNPHPTGGQTVGMPHPHIRVTHLPTGLVAECRSERSQLRCRKVCEAMIEWGLAEIGWIEP